MDVPVQQYKTKHNNTNVNCPGKTSTLAPGIKIISVLYIFIWQHTCGVSFIAQFLQFKKMKMILSKQCFLQL